MLYKCEADAASHKLLKKAGGKMTDTNKKMDGLSMERQELAEALLRTIKGNFMSGGVMEEIALESYDMGEEYAKTRRFNNSGRYHNYNYELDDGSKVSASSFFRIFNTRFQTPAYMDAEKYLREFFDDEKEVLFHLVRDQRFGINGVFKAVVSPREMQHLSFTDYVLVIACFGAGFMKQTAEGTAGQL